MGSLLRVTLGGAIQFKTALAPQLWPALVDPTQIELIVLNLVINARDAMRLSGTLILETSNTYIGSKPVQPEDPPLGDYVALAVNDTGTGIRDDVLPHVFEPFSPQRRRARVPALDCRRYSVSPNSRAAEYVSRHASARAPR
jgi:signal transduction histidine kinase